ncbi:CLIP-associated protein, partial [Durusdinium trenchii]
GFELLPNFCHAGEQLKTLDGWNFTNAAVAQVEEEFTLKHHVMVYVILERQSGFYVKQVLSIYWFLTTLMFSFFVLQPEDFTKRLVDILKIVLTQTTFRFSVEHRLPKVQVWTPFDVYLISCQILCCLIVAAFLVCFILSQKEGQACLTQEIERIFLVVLASVWVIWNLGFIIYAAYRKRPSR